MKHRIFIAIDLPDSCRSEIISLQKQLDGLGLPVVWEPAQKLHLTLHFLGATPQEQLANLHSQLNRIATTVSPFSLIPYFLETLYKRHEAPLVYLSLRGDINELKDLQASLGDMLMSFRFPAQNKFFPHITIGKLKRDDPVSTKIFLEKINDYEIVPLTGFTVDHFTLYESFVTAAGSHYQKIGQYKVQ